MTRRKSNSKQVMKAFNNVMDDARGNNTNSGNNNKRKQKQIQILDRVELEKDEFTEHKTIKHALIDFVVEAERLQTYYRAQMKEMIRTVALKIESELIRLGKSELISHISEELIRIIKHVGLRWNAIYLRRCLDERFKNPINRANALARERHPRVPEDSGRTVEELQAALEAERTKNKSVVGEYVVKCELKPVTTYNNALRPIIIERAPDGDEERLVCTLPLIIRVKAGEQNATAELDEETYKKMIFRDSNSSMSKLKSKSRSKPSTERGPPIDERKAKTGS